MIIVGRGGGSLEDLWAFNEEIVVRAIAACPIPIVSAVGHEVDVTLSDLAADLRAATPSAAAEVCVPEKKQLLTNLEKYRLSLLRAGQNALLSRKNMLSYYEKRLASRHPAALLQGARARSILLSQRMQAVMERSFTLRKARLSQLSEKLNALGPRQALSRGYAVVLADGQAVTSVEQARDEMTLLLQDGRIQVRTIQIRKEDPFDQETAKL